MKNLICRIWYTFYVINKNWKKFISFLGFPVLFCAGYILCTIIPSFREKAIRRHGSIEKGITTYIKTAEKGQGMCHERYMENASLCFEIHNVLVFSDILLILSIISNWNFLYDVLPFFDEIYSKGFLLSRLIIVFSVILFPLFSLFLINRIPYLTYDTQTYEAYLRQFRKCSKLENLKWHTVSLFIIISTLVFGLAGMYILFVIMQDKMSSYEAVNIFFHQLL